MREEEAVESGWEGREEREEPAPARLAEEEAASRGLLAGALRAGELAAAWPGFWIGVEMLVER
jgi:hypothetical protein